MKVLLTATGVETEEIKDTFIKMLNKDMNSVKALFITVAAINAGAIAVLHKCMNDLLKCNIPEENITVCDLHKGMTQEEINMYDIVYLCGGIPEYLLERINDMKFNEVLLKYIDTEGVVIGVSA